jgi:UDP-N-acetylglucosamine 2-epimerase (non-hydrolysing)
MRIRKTGGQLNKHAHLIVKQLAPILCISGARPNFMKIAPIMHAFAAAPDPLPARLVHTGQHYDHAMKDTFFRDLGIPVPDVDLEVGSGSHAVQTAEVMRRFEPVVDAERPAAVLVVGDVNSTIACALVAVKKGIPVVHVEAGLRSFDREMPEEINRVLTDQIADYLFTTEQDARANLLREGIAEDRIHFVGNVMIDSLRANLPRAVSPDIVFARHGWQAGRDARGYALVTLHRPSNVDDPTVLGCLLQVLRETSEQVSVVFAVHPRTQARIESSGHRAILKSPRVLLAPPLPYLENLGLMAGARVVMTDSGGMQEETTALGVPCLTLRENTERPITVTEGTNTVVGTDPDRILAAFTDVLASGGKRGRVPPLWDGKSATRIAAVLHDALYRSPARRGSATG